MSSESPESVRSPPRAASKASFVCASAGPAFIPPVESVMADPSEPHSASKESSMAESPDPYLSFWACARKRVKVSGSTRSANALAKKGFLHASPYCS